MPSYPESNLVNFSPRATSTPPAASAPQSSPTSGSLQPLGVQQKLQILKSLYEQGLIDGKEYQRKQREILNQM